MSSLRNCFLVFILLNKMILLKWNSQGILIRYQISLPKSVRFIKTFQALTSSTPLELTEQRVKDAPEKKILKVALMGRPNAGKSTLINKIFNLELCGVSYKTHTTVTPFKTSLTEGGTQIVLMDTPGLVTKREYHRFNLSESFIKWKKNILNEVDIVGVVNEIVDPTTVLRLHFNLIQQLNNLPQSLPVFIVLNKVDLVVNKEALDKLKGMFSTLAKSEGETGLKIPKIWRRFSKVFFTSATNDIGVQDVKNFLVAQAKPGNWIYESDCLYDKPLNFLILDLVRAQILDHYPNEIPYLCKYEIEYLKENNIGQIICVCLITCNCKNHHRVIVKKWQILRKICIRLETDLYKILGKAFRVRLVFTV